jgi:hypothetical protein
MYVAQEHSIYGSSRVGVDNRKDTLYMGAAYTPTWGGVGTSRRALGLKSFELANHLGNVLVTISDKPIYNVSSGTIHFNPEITSISDYCPFGAPITGRGYSSETYRFGFNTQEKTNEIAGPGNHNTATFWEYDTRLGRRWNQDPKIVKKNNYTAGQKAENQDITDMWKQLPPEAKAIYRDVRAFYENRNTEYQMVLNKRISDMKALGVTDKKINDIKQEFEKSRARGPYFPLMRHGRFWYQVGEGATREYYMFETQGQKEKHLAQRLQKDPKLEDKLEEGSTYKGQMDLHARQSQFLQNSFEAIDSAVFKGSKDDIDLQKQVLKDSIYQNYLANQPEQSFRKAFMNRNNIAGYSEDALRNFARSSFHMAYQLSRFENSPGMFLSVQEARKQIKGRYDANKGYDVKVATIDTMLSFYLAFLYANRPYYDKDRILCMSKYLFDVQEKNRLAQKGLLKRFSINCIGHQETVEEMRAEKAKKYNELKNKKKDAEYDSWFLKYRPTDGKDIDDDTNKKNKKTKRTNIRKKKTKKRKGIFF